MNWIVRPIVIIRMKHKPLGKPTILVIRATDKSITKMQGIRMVAILLHKKTNSRLITC
jgi:hypothetical protein